MEFNVWFLGIKSGGKQIIVMDNEDASQLGIHSSDRVEVTYKNKHIIAIANVATEFPRGTLGIYSEVYDKLQAENGETVTVRPAERIKMSVKNTLMLFFIYQSPRSVCIF